jgi:hypothetical protein
MEAIPPRLRFFAKLHGCSFDLKVDGASLTQDRLRCKSGCALPRDAFGGPGLAADVR